MKKIYSLLFVSLFLFLGYSCEDGSLSHGDVYIPDPVEETDEDDGFSAEPTTEAVIKVQLGDGHEHQIIDGFGCAFAEWSHRIWNHMQREDVVNDLFGENGLKLNIFRGEVFPHYQNPTTNVIDFGINRTFNLAPNDPSMINDYWRDFNGSGCGEQVQLGQMWLVDILQRKYKDVKFMFSTWSPPGTMKSNGKPSGGSLKSGSEDEYADYLIDFTKTYQEKFGIDIYAISPSNEPNSSGTGWNGCSWSYTNLANFCQKNLRPALDKAGYQDMKIIFGEHSWWKAGVTFLENGLKACPELVNSNIIAAAHGYTLIGNTEFVQSPLCAEKNIHLWNTETSSTDTYDPSWKNAMQWATTFHNYLAVSNLNAFVWWAGARPCTNNEALIRLEEALPGTNYERAARYYSYGQFTKFIPEGSRRVDVKTIAPENDDEAFPKELLMTAYVKDDGTYTIVLVNNSTSKAFETKLEIEGKEFQTMIAYTSDEGVKWQRKKINPSLSGLRAITVPKFSVVTVTGKMKDIEAE